MKITFVSNYLTHHQIPFCDAMHIRCRGDFRFISTEPMAQERKDGGWDFDNNYKYEIRSYETNMLSEAEVWINSSDVVLWGNCPKSLLLDRIKMNKLIFRYSERILKTGRLHCLSPRAIKNIRKEYRLVSDKNVYMLCASAYAAGDYYLFGAYKNKCFKWGYFPRMMYYNIDEILFKKEDEKIKLLWCGRFLNWKHCDDIIKACHTLHDKYNNFTLDIIGDGPEKENLKLLVNSLRAEQYINFFGSMKPEQVRDHMERANIYIFTSDFNEGWGAVLNEAMNSGCAVVASHAVGSVPYLVEDGKNGLVYKSGNVKSLCRNIEKLIKNKELCEKLGRNAYKTIYEQWNSEVAADRFIKLSNAALNNNSMNLFKNGICSQDGFLSNNWYKE